MTPLQVERKPVRIFRVIIYYLLWCTCTCVCTNNYYCHLKAHRVTLWKCEQTASSCESARKSAHTLRSRAFNSYEMYVRYLFRLRNDKISVTISFRWIFLRHGMRWAPPFSSSVRARRFAVVTTFRLAGTVRDVRDMHARNRETVDVLSPLRYGCNWHFAVETVVAPVLFPLCVWKYLWLIDLLSAIERDID